MTMKTRFTIYEKDESWDSLVVYDIQELSDAEDRKVTRRRLMKRFGFLLDLMLDDPQMERLIIEREEIKS